MGFRNQFGLTVNPYNGELWAAEQGPNGGDEVNVILPGKNYGWPFASYGRDYMGPRFNAQHTAQGFEEPTVYWVPSIAVSGMTFYNGDRFPKWRRNLFVGGMREGEMSPTVSSIIVFTDTWQELRRESLLRDLHQRIRDVRQGARWPAVRRHGRDDAALLASAGRVTNSSGRVVGLVSCRLRPRSQYDEGHEIARLRRGQNPSALKGVSRVFGDLRRDAIVFKKTFGYS